MRNLFEIDSNVLFVIMLSIKKNYQPKTIIIRISNTDRWLQINCGKKNQKCIFLHLYFTYSSSKKRTYELRWVMAVGINPFEVFLSCYITSLSIQKIIRLIDFSSFFFISRIIISVCRKCKSCKIVYKLMVSIASNYS